MGKHIILSDIDGTLAHYVGSAASTERQNVSVVEHDKHEGTFQALLTSKDEADKVRTWSQDCIFHASDSVSPSLHFHFNFIHCRKRRLSHSV
jgi:hypothetical protein